MNLANAQVTLTYKVRGVQLQPGVYLFQEKLKGKILPKVSQFRTIQRPTYANCRQVIQFSEKFIEYAISEKGRPDRNHHSKAYFLWRKMNSLQRLKFHIDTYASDMGSIEYSYNVSYE